MKIFRTKYTATGLALLAILVLAVVPFVMGQGGETPTPAEPLKIEGVSLSEARTNGFVLTEPQGESAVVTAEQAGQVYGKGAGRVELAHLRNMNTEPDIDRLVWVVVLEPDVVPVAAEADYVKLAMNFVDAKTGELIIGYEEHASCTDTPETMAECEKRGIKPRPLETPVILP
jgi:hypothetical protein